MNNNDIYISRNIANLGHNNSASIVKKAINKALEMEKINVPCSVSVLFTDEAGIRELNKNFRNIDSVTDVLSFPMNILEPGNFDESICEKDPETGKVLLGDMAISIPRCEKQGEEFGHGYEREISYLTVHSILHLLGYDHVDEGPMKKQMRNREKEIMGEE